MLLFIEIVDVAFDAVVVIFAVVAFAAATFAVIAFAFKLLPLAAVTFAVVTVASVAPIFSSPDIAFVFDDITVSFLLAFFAGVALPFLMHLLFLSLFCCNFS